MKFFKCFCLDGDTCGIMAIREVNLVTRVHILNKAVHISPGANTLGEGMYSTILPLAMNK